MVAARSATTLVTSVPDRSLTTTLSAPPKVLATMDSTSLRSIDDGGDVAGEPHPPPVGGDVHVLVDVAAVEHQRVAAVLALDHVAAVARIPLEAVDSGAEQGDVVALLAVDEVVAVASEQDVDSVAAEQRVVARTAVDGDADERGQVPGRGEAVVAAVGVEDEVLGRADVDRERRRVDAVEPDAGAVGRGGELLGAVAAVDLDVSMPTPPSLRSVSSPGFQIIRSLPLCPKAWSSASPPVMVSFSLPPNSRSKPPRPRSVSLPAWPTSWSAPEPPVRVSLPAPPNRLAAGSAPLASLSVTTSSPPRPKTRMQRGVGDRRRASDDGDRAVVHEDRSRRIAADHDRVVGAVTEHGQHAGAERRGRRRVRRRARTGHRHRRRARSWRATRRAARRQSLLRLAVIVLLGSRRT